MIHSRRAPGTGAWARAALLGAIAFVLCCSDAATPMGVAEIQPAAAVWSGIGRMLLERTGYTTTLLPSGKVLVTGGRTEPSAEIYDPATGGFTATRGPMHAARKGHTATLLPGGEVLIAGGDLAGASELDVSTAEVYRPSRDDFIGIGPMLALHRHHTATLLPSGAVLIVGGDASQDASTGPTAVPTTTAEIFPAKAPTPCPALDAPPGSECDTSPFQPAGATHLGRSQHTATLLGDGSVLVLGGYTSLNAKIVTRTAERYHPDTGNFTLTAGATHDPRADHTATLLPSGKVLVAGTLRDIQKRLPPWTVDRAEIYDPTTDTFGEAVLDSASSLSDFSIPAKGTATLLPSGEVLLVGGDDETTSSAVLFDAQKRIFKRAPTPACSYDGGETATLLPSGNVLLLGGTGADSSKSCAESYDAGTAATWDTASPMSSVRSGHAATLLASGKVLITGGSTSIGGASNLAEIFDPATLKFSDAAAPMTSSRSGHTATLLPDGDVLITGGIGVISGTVADVKEISSAELYHSDCKPTCFEPIGGLAIPRIGHTATLLPSGKVLIAGGTPADLPPVAAELYDTETRTFSVITGPGVDPVTPGVHSDHTATLLTSGKVLLAGGDGLISAFLYDPRSSHMGSFAPTGPMRRAHAGRGESFASALLPSGKVLVVGLDSAELFDPEADSGAGAFSPAGPLAADAPAGVSATLLPSGKVLIAGDTSTQIYDPAADTFTVSASIGPARVRHTATLLPSGRVLFAGGLDAQSNLTKSARLWGLDETPTTMERQPILMSSPHKVTPGSGDRWKITGKGLLSRIEASSGTTRSSAANYPIARLLPIAGGAITGELEGWTPSQATWTIPESKLTGPALLFVITNGIASEGRPIVIDTPPSCRSNLDCGAGEVCALDGNCKPAGAPASPPSSCACASAGQRRGDAIGPIVAALIAIGALIQRRRRRPTLT